MTMLRNAKTGSGQTSRVDAGVRSPMTALRARCTSLALALALIVGGLAPAGSVTNPGVYTLALLQITAPLTAVPQTAILDLDGMTAVSVEASLSYGSGGTTAVAKVQTSCDGGTTWRDISYAGFTTSAAVKYANVSGLTSKATTAYADLVADGINDGLLCNQLRAVITSTGTYANTVLTVRAGVR